MRPPRLSRVVVGFATRRADRDFLLKDLEEEMSRVAGRKGAKAARRWYRRQVWTSIVPLVARRLSTATAGAPGGTTGDVLRQAVRWLTRHPRTAGATIVTLALALGAAGAAGSILYGVALRPLPFPDEARVVHLWNTGPDVDMSRRLSKASIPVVSLQDLEDWRRASRLYDAISGYVSETYTLTGNGDARRVRAMRVGLDFDRVLGIRAALGRMFTADEFQSGREHTVVLAHQFWLREFGGDPSVVGRTLSLDEQPYVIAGVLPDLPVSFPGEPHELWVPLIAQPGVFWQHQRGTGWVTAVGRVDAATTVAAATEELSGIALQLAQEHPSSNARRTGVAAEPVREALLGDSQLVVSLVSWAILAVLVVAAANLVNLLMAQAEERRREFAVRRALGADSAVIARQVGIEALLLAASGGTAAMLLLPVLITAFIGVYPGTLPAEHLSPGAVGFGAVAVLTLGAALLLALPQMRHLGRSARTIQIRATNRQTSSRADRRVRSTLVAAQVAFSIVLMAVGGLFVQTFARLASVNPGFSSDGVLVFSATPPASRYGAPGQTEAFHRAVLDTASSIPGVTSTAMAIGVPFVTSGWSFPVTPPGAPADQRVLVRVNMTSAVPLLPDPTRPIGQRVPYSGRQWEIIGVAGDVHQGSLSAAGAPQLILPWSLAGRRPQAIVVKVAGGDPLALLPAIRARVAQLDPAVPIAQPRRLSDVVGDTLADERFRAVLVAALALVAVLLAARGVYSVTAYAVSLQEREHGVRLALGATPGTVRRTVLTNAMRPSIVGVLVGSAATTVAGKLAAGFLFGGDAGDPWTLAGSAGVLLVIATMAALAPARRAGRSDPAALLRAD
jgi:putative ABC transport system permease protein